MGGTGFCNHDGIVEGAIDRIVINLGGDGSDNSSEEDVDGSHSEFAASDEEVPAMPLTQTFKLFVMDEVDYFM